MAASVAAKGINVFYEKSLFEGQSWRNFGVNFSRSSRGELSWSCAVSGSRLCHSHQYVGFGQMRKQRKILRAITKSYMRDGTTLYFDFAVIGSGIAGLRYALEVAKHGTVAVITKDEPHESNTNYAQGGVSAVLSPSDSVESHMQDTIIAGAYLCDEETVKVVCTEGPERIRELIAMGASFDHGEDGKLHLAKEGGHSHHRIVHAADMTGREIERALLEAAIRDPNIFLFEHHFAIDLLTSQKAARGRGLVAGAGEGAELAVNFEREVAAWASNSQQSSMDAIAVLVFINRNALEVSELKGIKVVRFLSKVTCWLLVGWSCLSNHNQSNSSNWRWSSYGPSRSSCDCKYGFHPTALADEGLPVTPAARENAFLITEAVRGDGGILYNRDMERFMPLYDDRAELAPRDVQAIPVVPAAHYMCGGVRAGLQGETNVEGLYVAGEVACTVFPASLGDEVLVKLITKTREIRKELQAIMWKYVGIVRSTARLTTAEKRIAKLEDKWRNTYFSMGGSQQWLELKLVK
ncbi:L-aspartate oxidase chloroplastic [Bienertia sinuspersici]